MIAKRRMLVAVAGAVVGACALVALAQPAGSKPSPWPVPRRAAARKNPVPANATSIALGKGTYERQCLACHGVKGRGDGPEAANLDKRPTDLSSPKLREQSDGALLWRITEGHPPMPRFKNITSEEERWPLVNYLRTLAPKPPAPPPAKTDDLKGNPKP